MTRGVLPDLAPDEPLAADVAVTGAELEEAAERAGVEVLSGDAIVVHGGWDLTHETGRNVPGMTLDALQWMHRHDVSVISATFTTCVRRRIRGFRRHCTGSGSSA